MNSDFSRTSDATTAAFSSQDSISAQAQDFVYTTDRSSTDVEATTVEQSTAEDDDYNTRISQSSPAQSPADSDITETISTRVEDSTQQTNVNLNGIQQNAQFAPLVSTLETLSSSRCDGIISYATFTKDWAEEAFEQQVSGSESVRCS